MSACGDTGCIRDLDCNCSDDRLCDIYMTSTIDTQYVHNVALMRTTTLQMTHVPVMTATGSMN